MSLKVIESGTIR